MISYPKQLLLLIIVSTWSLFSSPLFREIDGFLYQTMQVPSRWHFWNARTAVAMQGNSSEIWWFRVLVHTPASVQAKNSLSVMSPSPHSPSVPTRGVQVHCQFGRGSLESQRDLAPHGPGSLSTQGPGCWNSLPPFWSFHSHLRDLILSLH